tara:strand:+ start:137 stop:445 length:309 start_codon:yes stop_codon:yes gene_type:complete
MFDFGMKDIVGRKITELKTTLVQYSKQEIRDPLISLLKWTAYGLVGLIFIIAGLGHLCLGILRMLQSEVSTFESNLSFLPYFIIFGFLALIAAISYRSIRSR